MAKKRSKKSRSDAAKKGWITRRKNYKQTAYTVRKKKRGKKKK